MDPARSTMWDLAALAVILVEGIGQKFNPRSVTGPTTLYMVKGTGVTVQ